MDKWQQIWKSKVSQKIKVFMWKLRSNVLPVRECLARIGILISLTCPACEEVETPEHLIAGCIWTHQVWNFLLGQHTLAERQLLMQRILYGQAVVETSPIRTTTWEYKREICMATC